MVDLFGAAAVMVLALLGLIGLVVVIIGVYLAYHYDITFNIRTKEKAKLGGETDGGGSWSDRSDHWVDSLNKPADPEQKHGAGS